MALLVRILTNIYHTIHPAKKTPETITGIYLRQQLIRYSAGLILGSVIALILANLDPHAYHSLQHSSIEFHFNGSMIHVGLHHLVNDFLMALFFALAGKEVAEAIFLRNGALNSLSKASVPMLATIGGIVGPALIYIGVSTITGSFEKYGVGWAASTPTDIAFSFLIAKMIFGKGHPVLTVLLALAILDDAAGVLMLAVLFPQGDIALQWLGLVIVGMALGLAIRKAGVHNYWWYVLVAGVPSMAGFIMSGLHPVLGLLPMVAVMPHAESDLGIYAYRNGMHDTLNEFEHSMKGLNEVILFAFGLLNAGVHITPEAFDLLTWVESGALVIGKPLGISLAVYIGVRYIGLKLPEGVSFRDMHVMSIVAGIGFTVALFFVGVAFEDPHLKEAGTLGALFSFVAGPLAFIAAKVLHIKKYVPEPVFDDRRYDADRDEKSELAFGDDANQA